LSGAVEDVGTAIVIDIADGDRERVDRSGEAAGVAEGFGVECGGGEEDEKAESKKALQGECSGPFVLGLLRRISQAAA